MECRALRGMTLVELLTTIVLIVTALCFCLPAFMDFFTRARIKQYQSDLTVLTQQARLHALTHRKRVTICPLDSEHGCHRNWNSRISSFEDVNGNRKLDPGEKLISTLEPSELLSVTWRGMGGNRSIHFNMRGHTAVTNGRLRLCSKGKVIRELVLNRQGRFRSNASEGSQC
ncbi:GspH/FimT family pseudopilin [Metapseudomonas furukawaii]|uniref:GspH/FimT family pseudopilin n=1 Tax=Metapseudomonas furukawaii TaxID=1149133 RepID=UPI004045D839